MPFNSWHLEIVNYSITCYKYPLPIEFIYHYKLHKEYFQLLNRIKRGGSKLIKFPR